MLAIEIGVFLAVCAIGYIGWMLGKSRGYEDGYGHGYIEGQNKVLDQWMGTNVKRVINPKGYTRPSLEEAINTSLRKNLGH